MAYQLTPFFDKFRFGVKIMDIEEYRRKQRRRKAEKGGSIVFCQLLGVDGVGWCAVFVVHQIHCGETKSLTAAPVVRLFVSLR